MNNEQEQFLQKLKLTFLDLLDRKFRKGAEEHHGDLLDLSVEQLLDEAIGENVDQITYLLTLKQKLSTMTKQE